MDSKSHKESQSMSKSDSGFQGEPATKSKKEPTTPHAKRLRPGWVGAHRLKSRDYGSTASSFAHSNKSSSARIFGDLDYGNDRHFSDYDYAGAKSSHGAGAGAGK